MPILTTTIEDPCPLISYSTTGWRQGSGESDPLITTSYSQSSFTASKTGDASVSFSFNGTDIELFGSRRDNHGNYEVTIDNRTSSLNGFAQPNLFKQSLFSALNLTQGYHTITLTNKPTDNGHNFVDIDFITWKSHIGEDDDKLIIKGFQDTDPAFLYTPSDAWSTNPDQIGLFSGGSGHQITGEASGSLTYTFSRCLTHPLIGDGVQLFGPIGPLGAPYSVQVDGGPVRSLTSAKDFYAAQMMLFHADNLGDGKHVLQLEYRGSLNQSFAIDYANVLSTSSTNSGSQSQGNSPPQSSGKLSNGIIAAIVILVLFIVACISTFILIMRRRWYMPPADRRLLDEDVLGRPALPANTATSPSTMTFTSADRRVSLARYSTTGRSYYTHSEGIPEEPISEPSVPYATVASSLGEGQGAIVATHITRDTKGQTVMASRGAARGLPSIPIDEPLRRREVPEGRSQSFHSLNTAPPDYHQATES